MKRRTLPQVVNGTVVLPRVAVEFRPEGPLWARTRRAVARRDRWTCQNPYCGKAGLSFQRGNGFYAAHVDHIIPLALNGDPWDMRNLQLLCAPCNLSKGSSLVYVITAVH